MKTIPESEMIFGKFDEADLFHIEKSQMYKKLGSGIKTVEFVLMHPRNSVIFLEAKKSCPNAANRFEDQIKERKFEEYYTSIAEKFIMSLQIYLAAILNRYQDISEVGEHLQSIANVKEFKFKFVLVIKNAEDVAWLAGPLAELKARLLQVRKIWNIEIAVLNEGLAMENHLVCRDGENI